MELKLKYITRYIAREKQAILLNDVKLWANGEPELNGWLAGNMDKANDFLVREMFWVNQEEVDKMSIEKFNKCLKQITDLESTPSDKPL